MGELTFFLGLQVKQKADGIFISQDKYVAEILKKFDFANVKTASTPIETQKPLVKDKEASDVDVHLYRSMIGSLMYLTASRPDIMFAVCACSRFQVTPKSSHLSVVKRIFRYLKGKPKLGLWYPRVSSFDLESYSDSDYAGANLDRKSTTGADLLTKAFDVSRLIELRESLRRVIDGTEALLILTLFILWLNKVSTDNAKLVPLGKIPIRNLFQLHSYLQALISLLTTISLSTTMAVLDSCPKHNMVAYLEKSEGNAEFHEIIDFLKRSSIHHALTVSPVVSTTFVEQFWTSAKDEGVPSERPSEAQPTPSPTHPSEKLLVGILEVIPSVHRDPLFDEIPEDTLDYMETENAQDVGRTSDIVGEEKEHDKDVLSTEDVLSTDNGKLSTDKEKVSTDRPIVSTDGSKVSTVRQIEEGSATQTTQPPPSSTIFGDDETIAKVLLNMSQAKAVSREKEKGVELKDIEETDRPRPTSTRSLLTLKPLLICSKVPKESFKRKP
ncbi:hypothetical protein Tco_0846833 [Tanacetum coccineum]